MPNPSANYQVKFSPEKAKKIIADFELHRRNREEDRYFFSRMQRLFPEELNEYFQARNDESFRAFGEGRAQEHRKRQDVELMINVAIGTEEAIRQARLERTVKSEKDNLFLGLSQSMRDIREESYQPKEGGTVTVVTKPGLFSRRNKQER